MRDSLFDGNQAYYLGGGIYLRASTQAGIDAEITGSTFTNNSVAYGSGGGIFHRGNGTLTITDSVFSGNSAGYLGGGVYNTGGSTVISGSLLEGNDAVTGGGFTQNGGAAEIRDSSVVGNTASAGGGISVATIASLDLTNVTVAHNAAGGQGGGLFLTGNAVITNSTFTGNRSGSTSAGYSGGAIRHRFGTVDLIDSVVTGNSAASGENEILTLTSGAGATLNVTNSVLGTALVDGATTTSLGADQASVAALVFAETVGFVDGNANGTQDMGEVSLDRDVLAGRVADNGGAVPTVALLADAANPALDASVGNDIPDMDARGVVAFDQLGIGAAAPEPGIRDLGAFEATDQADVTPPDAPIIEGITDDTGRSAADGITMDGTLTVRGTAEAGATVRIFANGNVPVGTGTASSHFAGAADTFEIELISALPEGNHVLTAEAEDLAGNRSEVSQPFNLEVDTTPPSTPTRPDLDPASDSGRDDEDDITDNAGVVISTSSDVGAEVVLTSSINGEIGRGIVTNQDGSISFAGISLDEGDHLITATATDAAGNTSTVSPTLTVEVDRTAPDAMDDQTEVLEEGSVLIDVLANDDPLDGDDLTILEVEQPGNGQVEIENGQIRYTPNADYNGPDSFEYTITDGNLTDTATVTINVIPVNDPPVAVADEIRVTEDDGTNGFVVASVTGNDSDPDGDDIAVTTVTYRDPATGALIGVPVGPATEVPTTGGRLLPIIFSDTAGQPGVVNNLSFDLGGFDALNEGQTDSFTFTYTIADGEGGEATATATITIDGVNDAPVIDETPLQVFETQIVVGPVGVSDPDHDRGELDLEISGGDDAALFDLAPGGVLVFRDGPDFEAPGDADGDNTYEVELTATDPDQGVDVQLLTVEVVNDPRDDGPTGPLILGNSGTNILRGSAADEIFRPFGGPTDVMFLDAGGSDTIEFFGETANGRAEIDYVIGFGPDDVLSLGATRVAEIIPTFGRISLVLEGDGDIIVLNGVNNIDLDTQVIEGFG